MAEKIRVSTETLITIQEEMKQAAELAERDFVSACERAAALRGCFEAEVTEQFGKMLQYCMENGGRSFAAVEEQAEKLKSIGAVYEKAEGENTGATAGN